MKFLLACTVPPATRDAAVAPVLETGGRLPPGVRRLWRWTQLDRCGGVVVLKREDPQVLTAFAHGWSDVVALTMAGCLKASLGLPTMRPRRPGITLLALVAWASQRVTVTPGPLQDIAPIPAGQSPPLGVEGALGHYCA